MEIQSPTHQEITNLISHSLKLLLTSLTKTTSKTSKLIFINLKYLLKSSISISQKTLQKILNLHHHHHHHHYTAATALSCRPSNAENYLSTFISPRDYQFSCSSSPIIRRRSKHRSHNYKYNIYHHQKHSNRYYNNVSAVEAVDQVLNILNRGGGANVDDHDYSTEIELPGFGKSPVIERQLRVTDSPFSLREGVFGDERSDEVDKAAEEFIDRFYNELKLQRNYLASVPTAVHGGDRAGRVDNGYNRTRRT